MCALYCEWNSKTCCCVDTIAWGIPDSDRSPPRLSLNDASFKLEFVPWCVHRLLNTLENYSVQTPVLGWKSKNTEAIVAFVFVRVNVETKVKHSCVHSVLNHLQKGATPPVSARIYEHAIPEKV